MWRRPTWRRNVAASTLALLAACSLPGDERTFTADGVTVVDGTGLVTGVAAGAPDPSDERRPLVVSPGGLTRLAVHWLGSSCVERWRVAIPEGNALRIVIEPDGAQPEGCTPSQEPLAVTLELNRAVQADAIEVDQPEAP
jgi:hypothetical protein